MTMMTRSKTKKVIYDIAIDFDEASRAWLANKISLGGGTYEYKPIIPKETTGYNLRSNKKKG